MFSNVTVLPRIIFLIVLGLLFVGKIDAQLPNLDGLQFYYPFEECPLSQKLDDKLGNTAGVFKGGISPECICGVQDTAIRLDGGNDYVTIEGSAINQTMGTVDFSFSFYFRPVPAIGIQEIFAKRNLCDPDFFFNITYQSNLSEISVKLREELNVEATLTSKINPNACWTHVAFVRDGSIMQLYINGELAVEQESPRRIDFTNGGDLLIAAPAFNPCPGLLPYRGWLDEIALFRGALLPEEIQQLYRNNERILNMDTTVLLGESVDIRSNISCSDEYRWTPSTGVSDPNDRIASITPDMTQTYTLRFARAGFCNVSDTIRITVIDPNEFDCDQVFLPTAFTPNGDNRNDVFGISNPFVFGNNSIVFEIFDRWGSRVFYDVSASAKWDATFQGEPVNPGVYHYRLVYDCKGESIEKWGSVTVMK